MIGTKKKIFYIFYFLTDKRTEAQERIALSLSLARSLMSFASNLWNKFVSQVQ